jgi:hypothetical protein
MTTIKTTDERCERCEWHQPQAKGANRWMVISLPSLKSLGDRMEHTMLVLCPAHIDKARKNGLTINPA